MKIKKGKINNDSEDWIDRLTYKQIILIKIPIFGIIFFIIGSIVTLTLEFGIYCGIFAMGYYFVSRFEDMTNEVVKNV